MYNFFLKGNSYLWAKFLPCSINFIQVKTMAEIIINNWITTSLNTSFDRSLIQILVEVFDRSLIQILLQLFIQVLLEVLRQVLLEVLIHVLIRVLIQVVLQVLIQV